MDEDQEGSDVDEEDQDLLDEMIQTAQFHAPQPPHPRSFQVSLIRLFLPLTQNWELTNKP